MSEIEKVKIGKIIDAHGIKGEFSIFVFSGDVSWLEKIKHLFILKNKCFEKHQIVKKRAHKKGFICLLSGFTTRNQAEEYKGCEIWLESDLFVSQDGESLYLKEILDFEIIDETLGVLGKIKSFSSNTIQDLLVIESSKKEDIEIPFIKEFVKNIDFKNKKIQMQLPEGLLDINGKE